MCQFELIRSMYQNIKLIIYIIWKFEYKKKEFLLTYFIKIAKIIFKLLMLKKFILYDNHLDSKIYFFFFNRLSVNIPLILTKNIFILFIRQRLNASPLLINLSKKVKYLTMIFFYGYWKNWNTIKKDSS